MRGERSFGWRSDLNRTLDSHQSRCFRTPSAKAKSSGNNYKIKPVLVMSKKYPFELIFGKITIFRKQHYMFFKKMSVDNLKRSLSF